MNYIICDTNSGNRLEDGINKILQLNDDKFEELMNKMLQENRVPYFYYEEEMESPRRKTS